jgi:hypothetical protein
MPPDVEAALIPWLTDRVGVSGCTKLPANLADVLPLVRVNVVGGTADRFSTDARVDIDAFAATYSDARDLAAAIHDAMAFLHGTTGDIVVRSVRVDSVPAERPYDNTTLSRVGGSYTVSARTNSYA